MKKNNGFTLIELLAVITVLAIVLLIAVPAIGNVIEKSKKNTFESSAKGLLDAANYFHSKNILSLSEEPYIFSFDDGKSGEAIVDEKAYKLAYSGKAPDGGHVTLRDDGKIELYVCSNDYCACKSYDSPTISIVDTEVENCGLNEDGTVADNPIFSNELETLKGRVDTLENTVSSLNSDLDDVADNYLKNVYPVGSIYMSVSSTNPGSGTNPKFPGTTWVAWGAGRVPVGVNTSDTAFDTVEETGGEKTHTLSVAEMPNHTHTFTGSSVTTSSSGAHTHTFSGTTSTDGSHIHGFSGQFQAAAGTDDLNWSFPAAADFGTPFVRDLTSFMGAAGAHAHTYSGTTSSSGAHTHTVTASGTNSSIGSGSAHNNLQPYITVYMWKRTN